MLSDIISRSTAAFGGAPFRLCKCTALDSAGAGAGAGAAVGGVPGALVGGALGTPPTAEPVAAPPAAEVKAVHFFKRKGAPPKAAVRLKIS